MKKIIGGKKYDTETAKCVGEYSSLWNQSDFHYYKEKLYRKKTGEFFLFGSGNAASKYSRSCGQNELCGDSRIIPLSYEGAMEWAENHMGGDDYEAIFGPVPEGGDKVQLHAYISPAAKAAIERETAKAGITAGDFLERLIAGMKEDQNE